MTTTDSKGLPLTTDSTGLPLTVQTAQTMGYRIGYPGARHAAYPAIRTPDDRSWRLIDEEAFGSDRTALAAAIERLSQEREARRARPPQGPQDGTVTIETHGPLQHCGVRDRDHRPHDHGHASCPGLDRSQWRRIELREVWYDGPERGDADSGRRVWRVDVHLSGTGTEE